jgi:hypothetical protein
MVRRYRRSVIAFVAMAVVALASPLAVTPLAAQDTTVGGPEVSVAASNTSRVGTLDFPAEPTRVVSSITDGTYGYFGLNTSPGRIAKIRLSDRAVVGLATLRSGEILAAAAVSDGTSGYFTTLSAPGKVIKLRLSDLARIDELVLPTGVDDPIAAVADDTYAYFVSETVPARLSKVRLSDLEHRSTRQFTSASPVRAATIFGVFGFFGTLGSPGSIVKVNLAAMTERQTLNLETGESNLLTAFNDGTYGYFGTGTSPGKVVKVLLNGGVSQTEMQRIGSVGLSSGESRLISSSTDGTFGYFGTDTTPAVIVKIDLGFLLREGAITLTDTGPATTAISGASRAWFATAGSPASLIEVETTPEGASSCSYIDEAAIPLYARSTACWLAASRITVSNPYRPLDPVTRAQMAGFLWRLAGQPPAPATCGFDDERSIPSWAARAACWLKLQGITVSDPYLPFNVVTREQMAAFLWRTVGTPSTGLACPDIVDETTIEPWARDAVCWLNVRRVTTNNPYRPKDPVSRAEMSAFLFRLDRL